MAEYLLQEATLELPDIFKDRTMNLFTLNDNGASEFTFVISRASAKSGEKLQAVAARLARELEVTVPDFRLLGTEMREIDGHPAVELYYQFTSDRVAIFQRQCVVLLDEQPAGKKIVCYVGTCQGEFNDYYLRQYRDIIASIKFHQQSEAAPSQMIPADTQDLFFALDSDSKVLTVFDTIQALYQHLPLQRAKEGQYLLFAGNGDPLKIAPIPGSNPLRYALWTMTAEASGLASQLAVCRQVVGPDALNTPEKIRAFLTQRRAH